MQHRLYSSSLWLIQKSATNGRARTLCRLEGEKEKVNSYFEFGWAPKIKSVLRRGEGRGLQFSGWLCGMSGGTGCDF